MGTGGVAQSHLGLSMPNLDDDFREMTRALVERYGGAETGFGGNDHFEKLIAVLLHRALGPKKGGVAWECLRRADLLEPKRLNEIDLIELIDLVRNRAIAITADSLSVVKRLARWVVERHDGDMSDLADSVRLDGEIREDLAAIRGIGVAGADALLLHGLERPSYSVDRSSFRILIRHGWADPTKTNEEVRELLTHHASRLAEEDEQQQTRILASLSHGMSQVGRQYCRAARPRCVGCPLEPLLPAGGPLDVES